MNGVEFFLGEDYASDDLPLETGKWYWWSCQPGCLPDGDPVGPFDSYEEARRDFDSETK